MKINNLFAKGLVIAAITSTMALGVGVAGASASDGHHDRSSSGSERRHDTDDDDDERLTIGGDVALDISDVNDLNRSMKILPPPILDDIEILS